ncbi:hypothetical protein ACSBR2_033050 [Camellia fascicularis]
MSLKAVDSSSLLSSLIVTICPLVLQKSIYRLCKCLMPSLYICDYSPDQFRSFDETSNSLCWSFDRDG